MKFLISSIIWILLTSSISAKELPEDWMLIDFSKVVPIEEVRSIFKNLTKQTQQNTRSRRIFGGREVEPNSHPYQVAIFIHFDPIMLFNCGGSILNSKAILTAAHCLDDVPKVTVVAGAHNIRKLEPTQQRRSSESENFRIHRGWNKVDVSNDIGIILLTNALEFNAYVTPTRLPIGLETDTFAGEWSSVIGWGITGDNKGSSPVLREAFNTVLTNQECSNVWGSDDIFPTMLCTASIGQSACSADSGGSLTVLRDGDSRPLQIGIVSFGSSSCENGVPSVFTRITEYLGWIKENEHF